MVIDLTRFDWTAVAAIGQIVAAAATLLSLWLLWSQIKLTRSQVQDSQRSLNLAMEQVQDSRRQSEQSRHDAVYPDLSVDRMMAMNAVGSMGDRVLRGAATDVHIGFSVHNNGIGVAKFVAIYFSGSGSGPRLLGSTITAIPPGVKLGAWIDIPRPATGNMSIEWHDVLHKQYSLQLSLSDDGERLKAFAVDAAGTMVVAVLNQVFE